MYLYMYDYMLATNKVCLALHVWLEAPLDLVLGLAGDQGPQFENPCPRVPLAHIS